MIVNKTQFTFSLRAEWNPSDPEVESIWFLFKKAAEKIEDEKTRDEADFCADRIYEKLQEARNHYKMVADSGFNSRPSSEIAAVYNSLYNCLWSAYKDRLVNFTRSFGYDIGCIFAGKDYEQQMSSFITRHPEVSNLKSFIDIQKRNWQDHLRDNRNGNEHDGDFRNKKNVPDFNNQENTKQVFIAVSITIEMVGITLLSYKLPKYINVILVNNKATVFDRTHRYEVRHALQGTDTKPLFDSPYY